MDKTEREETTEYASKKINSYLENDDYTSALLLASIYASIRLRTLLTNWISPPKDKWKQTSEILKLNFSRLITLCTQHKLLHDNENKKLDALRKKRNEIAHESALWKELSDKEEKKKIKQLCMFTKNFLERTKH